jgi:Domain of unknown function (DUF222)/HNH endonuclease
MNSNVHSTDAAIGLTALAAAVDQLAAEDLHAAPDAVLAHQVLELQTLENRLHGLWLQRLATVDGRGAAGADQGQAAPSTAGWLRARLRVGATAARGWVRTARALYRGPLTGTAEALAAGEFSPAHAQVLAAGTHHLPAQVAAEAEPVLDTARRLDPPRLRRVVTHLRGVLDPEGADALADRQQLQRRLWLSPTLDGMVAVDGLLDPEAGQSLLAALEPLARPADAGDERSAAQRRADALAELARRSLEGGRLPQTGGVRPQLIVTVDLDSLVGRHGTFGGEIGGVGPLDPEACRWLVCDGALTRVLVTRHPTHHHGDPDHHPHHHPTDHPDHHPGHGPTNHSGPGHPDQYGHPDQPRQDAPGPGDGLGGHDHPIGAGGADGLVARLRAAATLLPPALGGAPSQPLEVGRATRVVSATQRAALVVRDGGCAVTGCGRPPAWCEAHHLRHWLHGGATDLANLALVCRAHHRAVHEGGWQLVRQADGRLTATPPHPSHTSGSHRRRHPAAA